MTSVMHTRPWLNALGAAVVYLATATVSFADDSKEPAVTPSNSDFAFLAYSISGSEPPFAAWAEADRSVTSLNEFKRAAAAQSLEAQMRSRYQRIKTIRQVHMNLDTKYGEYSDIYHEFDFDINDGSYIDDGFVFDRHHIIIRLINGGLAQARSLPQGDAEKIIRLTGGDRHANLSMTVELVGASLPVSSDNPISLDARIIEYDIVSGDKISNWGMSS